MRFSLTLPPNPPEQSSSSDKTKESIAIEIYELGLGERDYHGMTLRMADDCSLEVAHELFKMLRDNTGSRYSITLKYTLTRDIKK